MPDHVHLLISLPPIDLAHFIGKVKGGSSFALNRQTNDEGNSLRWQDGYGVVSLRASDTPAVVRYIEQQEQIHAERTPWQTLERTELDEP